MSPGRYVFIFLIIVAASAVAGCLSGSEPGSAGSATDGKVVEVREYQGEKLSSIVDFRENSIKGPQRVDEQTYRLSVRGLVDNPREYTYREVLENFTHKRRVVTLYCVEGWDVTILWDGIPVQEVIAASDPDPAADTVIFYAVDGYSTSIPLSHIVERDILLAYGMNNVTLPAERGFPFQLVAEDRWGYKWIKWVNAVEISGDRTYRGYWEMRGYSNDAFLNRSFFG